jgi:hypothetical protein
MDACKPPDAVETAAWVARQLEQAPPERSEAWGEQVLAVYLEERLSQRPTAA